jgi:DNA-binding transcriptional MocR family regulator
MAPKEKNFRYRQLAEKIAHWIECGILKPGERVPSLREIGRQEKLSVTTALEAYAFLENQGYIEARPQSGYFVRTREASLPPEPAVSAPPKRQTRVSVGSLVATVLRSSLDAKVVPLGAAFPSPELLATRKLNHLLAEEMRRENRPQSYSYPPGEYELRRQIVRRALDWGARFKPDEVLITCGATQAIDLCLRAVTRPGDLVAVESPCYFGTLLQLEALGLSVVEIPSHPRKGICLDALGAALQEHPVRACIASPNFSNPMGSAMSDAAKRELVALLARKKVPLIEDDLYGDLNHAGERPKPAQFFDHHGLVMLCGSFSKTLAPGYRLGWCVPGRFRKRVEQLQMASTLALPKTPQRAVAAYLKCGAYDRQLRAMRSAFALQSAQMIAAIGKYFPNGTKVTRPAGGYLLWVELPRSTNAIQLCEKALEQGISISPGPMFSARLRYRNFIRINCGSPWSPRIERAIRQAGDLARSLATEN